ncbi:hypothetical protein JTE90_029400 [Oedothorax gibbosus]|uniref:Uncharacterized protein n=1 Tax=Oedothorax gibbosus TaxID=931172 RepID=A0AAV6UA07_9ARAC|nr:hypothetical protein JTE90_029400 [Oedothorax gibbosus]
MVFTIQTHHDNTNGLQRISIRDIQRFGFHPRKDFYHFNKNLKDNRDIKAMIHPAKIYNKERRGSKDEKFYQANSIMSDKRTRRNFVNIPKLKYAVQRKSLRSKGKIALDPRLAEWRMQRRMSDVRNHPRQIIHSIGYRQRQTAHPAPLDLMREKKSTSETVDVDYTMQMIKFFLFFIPLASFSAIVLTILHYFWSKRSKKSPSRRTVKRGKSTSESIVGSTLMTDDRSEISGDPSLNKAMADEFVNKFVTNDFNGEGDTSAKRMKLERWMYQEPRYLPEMAQKKMKVNKEIENRFPKCHHARKSSETSSSQSNSSPQIPFQQRPEASYQNRIPPISIDEIRRPESEIMGTYNVATSKHPQAVLKTYSEDPALSSIKSRWDKCNRGSINSVDKSIDNNNPMKNMSLVSFNSHYVTCERNPAQRYDYTMGGNMERQNRNSQPFRVANRVP